MTPQNPPTPLNDDKFNRLTSAMFDQSFPVNPIPFAQGLTDYVKERGTDSIKSDEAKQMLWVLMAQSYGQLNMIDLTTEWGRLYKAREGANLARMMVQQKSPQMGDFFQRFLENNQSGYVETTYTLRSPAQTSVSNKVTTSTRSMGDVDFLQSLHSWKREDVVEATPHKVIVEDADHRVEYLHQTILSDSDG